MKTAYIHPAIMVCHITDSQMATGSLGNIDDNHTGEDRAKRNTINDIDDIDEEDFPE